MNSIKEFVKFFFYLYGYIFHHNRKSKVFYYHDLGVKYTDMGTTVDDFIYHIKMIRRRGFEIVESITKPENQVMIAFDDGWRGIYDYKELLINNGVLPTVFIAVDLIDKDGYLSRGQIKELISMGFRFECHTWSHTGLPDHHGEDLLHELMDAKNELEHLFSIKITQICFPQGRYSSEVIDACRHSGYTLMYSSVLGSFYDEYNNGIIRRCFMYDNYRATTRLILEGDVPFIRRRDYNHHFEG